LVELRLVCALLVYSKCFLQFEILLMFNPLLLLASPLLLFLLNNNMITKC
jgi:hypothetical protein